MPANDFLIPADQAAGKDLIPANQISERPELFMPGKEGGEFIQPDEDTVKAATEALERYEHYLPKLQPIWSRWVKHWRLYMAARKNTRTAREKWRSWVHVPYPFSGIQTTVGSFMDVVLALDPPIKPSGIGPEDLKKDKKIERLIAYQMRKVDFPGELELFLIELFVQGIAFRKSNWINDVRKIWVHPQQDEMSEFEEMVVAAVEAGMPMPPSFEQDQGLQGSSEAVANAMLPPGGAPPPSGSTIPTGAPGTEPPPMSKEESLEAFEVWRQQAIANGIPVPEPPVPGPMDVINYRGTGFTRVSGFDMVYDPAIAPWSKQEFTFQRSVKTIGWLKSRAKEGDVGSPFDMQKLMEAIGEGTDSSGSGAGDMRVSSYQEEILGMMEITSSQGEEPGRTDDNRLVEVITCWAPGTEFPYRVMVNRHKDLVNKLKITPYWHGEPPLIVPTNNRIPGMLPAMGELWQPERLYYEMNTLRGLRIDGVLLSILPMFVRLREAGMVELAKKLIPGMIMEASRTDAVTQLTNIDVPMQAFTEIDKIKSDIDETNATFPNVRGGISSGSGTTATEANRAFENAMVRTTQRIVRFEGELTRWIRHSLFNWYQFAKPQERMRVGGDPGLDPFVEYRRKDFLTAIDMDFHFAGARTAVNTAEEIAGLKDLLITAVNAGITNANINAMFSRIAELVSRDASQFTLTEEQIAQQQAEAAEQGGEQATEEEERQE